MFHSDILTNIIETKAKAINEPNKAHKMDQKMTRKNFLLKNKLKTKSTTSPSQDKQIVRELIQQQG